MNDNYSMQGGIDFVLPTANNTIIKVIGVGGGGCNAVNHMFSEGIRDVSYVVCNTDSKSLRTSSVPNKLQLGDGLGAGNKPERGRQAAIDSEEEIRTMLSDGTRMVFITAGMGGGTGTGAGPIVAKCAKSMGLLTVGIVTIPFVFEGNKKIDQALIGVEELSHHVDALLVVNNERLRTIYTDLSLLNAFARADDTLTVAARSIADIITQEGIINLDFQDVTTVLKDGGVAVMSTGYAEGENRVTRAIEDALNSPLLNNNDIFNSKKVLININFAAANGAQEMAVDELTEIHDFMAKFRNDVETKFGIALDQELGNKVKITILASGYGLRSLNMPEMDKLIDERQRLSAEKEDAIAALREKFYDEQTKEKTRERHIFIFRPEDLDNDELISKVDSLPTYNRTRDELKRIRRTAPQTPIEPEPELAEA